MIEPTNRREMFLNAIATGCECPVEPLTREEILLAEHARREASGGAGGSSGGGSTPCFVSCEMVYFEDSVWWQPRDGQREKIINAVKAFAPVYFCAAHDGSYGGEFGVEPARHTYDLFKTEWVDEETGQEQGGYHIRFHELGYPDVIVSNIDLTKEEFNEIWEAWNAISNGAFAYAPRPEIPEENPEE